MESAYRLWIREKKDDIFKELQAALGTAKWQVLFWEPLYAQKSFLNNLLVCSCTILESRYSFVVNNQRIRQGKTR